VSTAPAPRAAPEPFIVAACGLLGEARRVAGPGVRPVAGGGDAVRLVAGLEDLLRQGAAGVISIGIAGGLDPDLVTGDVVVGTAVQSSAGLLPTDPAWTRSLLSALPGARPGIVAGADEPIAEVADKRRLWQAGAAAVDMESHLAAAVALRAGRPFAVLRVVTDAAGRTLPPAARVGMAPDGRPDIAAVLRSLLAHPAQLPALLRTAREAAVALRQLGACCHAAGPLLALYPAAGQGHPG
jgi:hopanoid-associated phosphorylase